MENTENVVLSRSLCYAMLAALAIALLVQAGAASGVNPWAAAQFAHDSAQGFHFTQLLASARISAGALRAQLHNTWLFLYVFVVVWAIVLAWSLFERRRLKLDMTRHEFYWMGWMTLSVTVAAVAYGAGTNGLIARDYPKAVPATDALALLFVLALPVFAWKRLQMGREQTGNLNRRAVYTTLHLNDSESNDDDAYTRPRVAFQESATTTPPEGMTLQTLQVPAPDATAMAAMDRLLESTVQAVTRQHEPVIPVLPEPVAAMAASRPDSLEVIAVQELPAVPEAKAAPLLAAESAKVFREQLKALNESWARIENAGQEIEQWFDEQRRQVIAHLQMHPRGRGPEVALAPSTDFLSARLDAVDSEWAAIRRSTLEISRWFGDARE